MSRPNKVEAEKPLELDEEESAGLVHQGRSKSSEGSSVKCQIVVAFLFVSLFMLLVGYVVGKDVALSAYSGGGGEVRNKNNNKQPENPVEATSAPSVEADLSVRDANLLSAKAKANDKLKLLEEYYGEHAAKVLYGNTGLTFGFVGPDKQPSNPVSFQRDVDIIARSLVHGESLKLGFIGSSVMCGHDNCYYDSFPEQLKRFIGPIFKEASGKDIEFRNACQGGTCGDSYQNQIFCFRHMVGDDIDFLFYEWTYHENGEAYVYHEAVTRWAALLPKVPATIIVNADNDAWKAPHLAERYAKWGVNGLNLEEGLKAGPYKGKVWGAVGDGIHETTRYGKGADVSEARKKSLGVVFRNWHPGPLGHQYFSDLTSYLFLRAFVKAVDDIVAAGQKAESKWPVEPHDFGQFPSIQFDKDRFSDMYALASLTEEPPGCYTVQKSTYGKPQSVIADRPEDQLNPYHEKVKKIGSGETAWSIWNAPPNWAMVPREERTMGDMCKPPDNCAYFVEPTQADATTPLVFRLPKMTTGLIALCGGNSEAGKALLTQKDKFTVEFDDKVLDASKYTIFPYSKCLCLQKVFSGPVSDKHGHLYLSIVTTVPLQISQIITA